MKQTNKQEEMIPMYTTRNQDLSVYFFNKKFTKLKLYRYSLNAVIYCLCRYSIQYNFSCYRYSMSSKHLNLFKWNMMPTLRIDKNCTLNITKSITLPKTPFVVFTRSRTVWI